MPSLSDYFAQRQVPAVAAPTLTDEEQNAAIDARNAQAYRQNLAATQPFSAGLAQGVSSLGDSLTAAKGLGQAALGYEQPAVATLRRAQQQMQDTAQYTPENAGDISTAYKTGNLGTYASYKLGALTPGIAATVVPALVTGGASALVAGGLRAGAAEAAGEAAVAGLGRAAVGDTAGAAATSALRQRAVQTALAASKNTGFKVGEFAGAAGAGAVQAAPSQVDNVLNDPGDGSTLQERARKGLAASAGIGAVSALPNIALLARYGLAGQATKQIAEKVGSKLLTRIASNAGEQGAIGGAAAAATVAVDRAAHAWITGHPSAAPALPDYINGIADGVLGGAVFGAPAGFRGERSVSDAMRAATSKISGDLDARAARAAQRPAPGEPVNPDGSKVAGSAQTQFDKNLSALKDGPDDHFDGLMASVKPYNVTDDGISATLNGPAAGLIDPARSTARAAAYDTLFDNPTQKTIASMLDDSQWTSAAVPGVKAAAKAFENGYSRLAPAEKNTLADFVNNTLAPDQAAKFKRVLATVDAMSPDTRARIDFQKSGKDLAEAPGTPKQFVGAADEPSLAAIPDDQWNAATFRQTKNGPARNSPAEENVRLVRTSKGGDDYNSDLNVMRAASALAATDTGKETLAGGGNRKVNAIMGVYAEAKLRGQHIPSSEIRPGLRVFPGEDGRLTPTEAATIRKSFDRATAKAKIERANPVAMADAQGEAPAPGRGNTKGAPTGRVTTDKFKLPQDERPQTANGDLQGVAERGTERYGNPEKNPKGALDPTGSSRQIENTARRSAEKLGIATKDRTPGQLYEDALHIKDSANGRALKSAVRQLSETDPEVARHMEQADHRKAVSDFAGERITGDNGALIPWLKAAVAGKKPTRAQLEAFKAIQERTDNFAGMSDKAKSYARSLIDQLPKKETAATKVIPNTLEENASNLSNAELKSRLSNKAIDPEYKKVLEAERDARGTKFDDNVPAKKETVGSINKEIAAADQYARNPPNDFTPEQAAKLEARMREVSARAAAKRDALGEEHDHYQTFDDIRMNAKDAANALKEVLANDKAARELHPDWFDKKVPLAEQSDPKGDIRTSIEAIQKTPQWKAIGEQLRELKNSVVTVQTKVREKAVLKTLAKAFGVSSPELLYHEGKHPAFITNDGRISLNIKLKGAARTSAMLHEFGHHLINEKFATASVETKKAMIADYKAWRRAQGNDALDTRLSRAPLFSGLRLLDELGDRTAANKDQISAADARYLLSVHEYFADSIARALEQHEGAQGIVGRFMAKVAQVTKLAYDLARGADSRLTDSPTAVRDWVHSLYEAPAEPDAVRAPPASASGEAPIPNRTSPDSLSAALSPDDRGALFKVFGRRDIMQQLLTGADKETAEALGNFATQMSTAINEGFKRWAAGDLVLADKSALAPLNNLREAVKTIFGIATNKELAERILKDAELGTTDRNTSARKVAEMDKQAELLARGASNAVAIRKAVFGVQELASQKMKPIAARFISSLDERMRATNVPALHALAAAVHRQTGERGTGQDMTAAMQQTRAQYWDRASKIINAIPEADRETVLKAAQAQEIHSDPALEAHRQKLISFFKDMEAYQRDKGVVMGSIKDYIPVVLDPEQVRNRATEFKAMLSEPQLEKGMRDYFESKGWDTSKMSQLDMIDKMHDMASYSYDYTRGGQSYADTGAQMGGKETRTRVSEFIYRQNDPILNKQFASFQTKDLEQLMIPYVSHAVRRAEFTNALGKTPDMKVSTLDQLLGLAKEQGATPDQIQMAKDYVNASIGSYAPGLNPFFAKTIGAFDRVFNTKLGDMNSQQYRNLSNAIIAYQNLRVLGLGLFGNLIDPLGVWTRSSSVSQTWRGYKGAFKATMSKDPTFLRNMAEALGAVEAHATTEALSYNYGSAEGDNVKGWSQRVNRALFKVNGMEMITNFARLAATETGNKFLLAHAEGANKHSERYLQELGLKPSDVVEDSQHPGYVKRSDKIDKALYQFVNESVLRPSPTQKPLWHNDPHFAVAAQYKGYLYAFYSTITERMLHEVQHGNASGVAPIAGYLGVSMAAELAREMVQFGPSGNPNRQDWDAGDYAKLAANRSGLAGPKLDTGLGSVDDVLHGGVPLASVAGPSVSQAQQLGTTIFGHGSAKNAAIEALPGQSLFHGWVEGR